MEKTIAKEDKLVVWGCLGLGIFLMVIPLLAFSTDYYDNYVEYLTEHPNPNEPNWPPGLIFWLMPLFSLAFICLGIHALIDSKKKRRG